MKIKSRLAVLLAVVLVCTGALAGITAYATELNSDIGDYQAALSEEEVQAQLVYQKILNCTTLKDVHDVMNAEENRTGMMALNSEQLNGLYSHAQTLYAAVAEPTADDEEYYELITETLQVIAEGNGAVLLAAAWDGKQTNGTFTVSGEVLLSKTVEISAGQTLTLDGSGTIGRAANFTGIMFNVATGGHLSITGTSDTQRIIIDGSGVEKAGRVITTSQSLNLSYVEIRNNTGGGINVTSSATGDITISKSVISYCTTTDGSAIMLGGSGASTVTLTEVEICNNTTANAGEAKSNGGTIRTNGDGQWKLTIDNCQIHDNASTNTLYDEANSSGYALKEGGHGGAVYWNAGGTGAKLTIKGGTKIYNNVAACKGGGLFLEGTAIDIQSVEIYNNSAYYGGGICINAYRGGSGEVGASGSTSVELRPTENEEIEIYKNSATAHGAGLAYCVYYSKDLGDGYEYKLDIDGATFYENEATENGGAIAVLNDYPWNGTKGYKVNTSLLSGTINKNQADNGGGIFIDGGNFSMAGGTIKEHNISGDGAGVYVKGGSFTMSTGEMYKNAATNGGAVYVTGGNFTMTGGTIGGEGAGNTASVNGGAVYVTGGSFTMKNGTMSHNTAPKGKGGAAYVTTAGEGTTAAFLMEDGTVNSNSAVNGGAVYVNGGSFTMQSGTMSKNVATYSSTEKAEEGTEGYGGAVFVMGGSATIGIKECYQDAPCTTHATTSTKHHPKMEENKAAFGGAVAVRGGVATFYCCNIQKNTSLSPGTGENVFMEAVSETSGKIDHYWDGASIGTTTDHGMVSVGGELNIIQKDGTTLEVNLVYDENSENFEATWEGTAPKDYYLNLPYCPKTWSEEQNKHNLTFVGWADKDIGDDKANVRKRPDYKAIGTAVQLIADEKLSNVTKGEDGKYTITFWAVWAPKQNTISYAYTLSSDSSSAIIADTASDQFTHNGAASYQFELTGSKAVEIGTGTLPGYAFKGWRIYANNDVISNWDADAKNYAPATLADLKAYADYEVETGDYTDKMAFLNADGYLANNKLLTKQHFGNITLVAVFEPAYTSLTITKTGAADETDSFVFTIKGTPSNSSKAAIDMEVVIVGNKSVTIENIPVGNYTITEQDGWSWRYNLKSYTVEPATVEKTDDTTAGVDVALTDPTEGTTVTFTNEKVVDKWLDGNAYVENDFDGDLTDQNNPKN